MPVPATLAGPIARWRARLAGLVLCVALPLAAGSAVAQGIDHAPFDALLRQHVRNGDVDYRGFQDSAAFKAYLAALAAPARLETRAERLAYHINAYNAFAIQGILDGLSPSSLLGRVRYFRLREWPLDGRRITLQGLEHEVLRPMGEPRIHFAIACASKSCPPLRQEAYVSAKLDTQLDDQARLFINDPFRNRYDKASRIAELSEIFRWFGEDFRGAGSVQKYISRHVADADVAAALARDAYLVEWITYDWTLNGTPPRR